MTSQICSPHLSVLREFERCFPSQSRAQYAPVQLDTSCHLYISALTHANCSFPLVFCALPLHFSKNTRDLKHNPQSFIPRDTTLPQFRGGERPYIPTRHATKPPISRSVNPCHHYGVFAFFFRWSQVVPARRWIRTRGNVTKFLKLPDLENFVVINRCLGKVVRDGSRVLLEWFVVEMQCTS
jgi:hypothetical protein